VRTHRHRPVVQSLAYSAFVALAATIWLAGCARSKVTPPEEVAPLPEAPSAGISGNLSVLVPCGQLDPFMEAKAVFMDKHPDVTVEEDVQNINVLRTKLLEDEIPNADVFLDMGDTAVKDLLEAGKTIAGTETPYARNWIAIVTPKDNPAGITKLEDLAKPSVSSIGLAEPDENSNGYYAREALQSAGLWDELEKSGKIFIVDQPVKLKGLVATKKVDAAFIYSVCAGEGTKAGKSAEPAPPETTMVGNVPDDLYTPFYCTATVLQTTQNEEAARAFVEFLATDEASEIWQKHKFGPRASGADEGAAVEPESTGD